MHARRVGADDLHFTLDTEIDEATRAQPHPINATTGEALCTCLRV
jgi:hypothetical protein